MSGRKLTTPEQAKIIVALHFIGDKDRQGTGEDYHALAREVAQSHVFVVDGDEDAVWLENLMTTAARIPEDFSSIRVDEFHAHLDVCEQCRNHPFKLCAEGQKVLGMVAGDFRRGNELGDFE
jgi:hypothetical protein